LIEERVRFHEEINILEFCAAIEHQERKGNRKDAGAENGE